MTTVSREAELMTLPLPRPLDGPRFPEGADSPGWSGNGGPSRGHPARALPYSFELPLPEEGLLQRIHLVGVFARYAGPEHETPGTLGAIVTLEALDRVQMRVELVNGRHYCDAAVERTFETLNGDGTEIRSEGQVVIDGEALRVDRITIDVPPEVKAERLKLRVMNGPSSFIIFDVFAEVAPPAGCPFSSRGGGIALAEVGTIVRLGDRVRFDRALDQLESSLNTSSELDEARGQALTFVTMVTAAMLESGGSRSLHREVLEAAREIDSAEDAITIAEIARRRSEVVAAPRFGDVHGPSAHLVDRALTLVDRHFAKDLTDASVAQQLGLSTSHFRFLFKQATGQPFHKYLIGLRLEKARRMLMDQGLPVGVVAKAVGFSALSHFSRAFTQRFQVSPTSVRRNGEPS